MSCVWELARLAARFFGGPSASLHLTGDTVLLAGKGHEDFQLVGRTRIPYSDRETVEQILRVRNAGRGFGSPAIPPEAF